MENKRNPHDSKDAFRRMLDALVPCAEDLNDEDVREILAAAGIDADTAIEKAYRSLQDVAGRRYLSQGENVPTKLREALRQMKPASPRERGTGGTFETFDKIAHPNELRRQVQGQLGHAVSA
jgi:hypothetical protein